MQPGDLFLINALGSAALAFPHFPDFSAFPQKRGDVADWKLRLLARFWGGAKALDAVAPPNGGTFAMQKGVRPYKNNTFCEIDIFG